MDKNRRKFLKIILVSSGMFVVGKIFNPLFSDFLNSPPVRNDSNKDSSMPFKIVENKKILSIYDNSGEEVLQIDKSN